MGVGERFIDHYAYIYDMMHVIDTILKLQRQTSFHRDAIHNIIRIGKTVRFGSMDSYWLLWKNKLFTSMRDQDHWTEIG